MVKAKDVTVKQCLEIMRQFEAVDATMRRFSESYQVSASYKSRDPTKGSQKNSARTKQHVQKSSTYKPFGSDNYKQCIWCGGSQHAREKCPAKDSQCNFCSKKTHFQKSMQAHEKE